MNNRGPLGGLVFHPFHFTQHFTQQINVRITISNKIHFMQHIVHLFGPRVLREILESPNPVIFLFILYETSFDVHVFILI